MPDIDLTFRQDYAALTADGPSLRSGMPKSPVAAMVRRQVLLLFVLFLISIPLVGIVDRLLDNRVVAAVLWFAIMVAGVVYWRTIVAPAVGTKLAERLEATRPPRLIHLTADVEGLRMEDEMSSVFYRWSVVQRVFETPNGIGIVADMSTYHIPASAFSSPAAKAAFMADIRSRSGVASPPR